MAGYMPAGIGGDGMALHHPRGIAVIVSVSTEQDEKEWVHLSVSRRNSIPSWEDMMFAKDTVLGREASAVQIIPAKAKHVNIHPNCLHFFHCPEGDGLPDFTRGSGSL